MSKMMKTSVPPATQNSVMEDELEQEGVVVRASPVEPAPPYFTDSQFTKPPILQVVSSLEPRNGVRGENRKVFQYKVDLDEKSFSPILSHFTNSLIALCHLAFAEHRPMALTPDLLWHYIMKGISTHINKYSEELRKKFVEHEDQKELIVDMKYASADEFSNAFKEMRSQIEENLTEDGKALISEKKFSTTTDVIDDVSCIALMDAMSKYFSYTFRISCGVPSVTLLGKKEDWMELRKRAERALNLLSSDDLKGDVSLSWWKGSLLPVLDKLIECYENPESASNRDWMARIYKYRREAYGGFIYVSGWVNVFFPYFGEMAKGSYINKCAEMDFVHINKELKERRRFGENHIDDFPAGISRVDFILDDNGNKQKMQLHGGPCCLSEQLQGAGYPCPPGTLHVNFGWMIKQDDSEAEEGHGAKRRRLFLPVD